MTRGASMRVFVDTPDHEGATIGGCGSSPRPSPRRPASFNSSSTSTNLGEITPRRTSSLNITVVKDRDNAYRMEATNENTVCDDGGRPCRSGTMWTATSHVITAVIGSGVLSLAWSIAQLGWAVGPPILLGFAFVTYYTSLLLADCYRFPGPATGTRNYSYTAVVRAHLGGIQGWICGCVQYINLIGTVIGYTITASISMVAIRRSNCFHVSGEEAPCHTSSNFYMALFGGMQLALSMIPNFDKIWWLSIVATVMSFSYSTIGLGLALAKTIERGRIDGTLFGVGLDAASPTKTWLVYQALGNIAFAYSFSMVLIEIQDTLKAPPAENKTMKKASLLGIMVTTIFYMLVGCFGYAALGNRAPGNLLTGFGFYNPYWLIDFANACIVIHLVGAYQVFSQPIFAFVESCSTTKWPKSELITQEFQIPLPFVSHPFTINKFRVLWRSFFVVFTTLVAMLLPFFNDIVGLLGAFAFWPLTVYYPLAMHISQSKTKAWTPKWLALQVLNISCLLISVAAGVGSIVGIVQDLGRYTPFKN